MDKTTRIILALFVIFGIMLAIYIAYSNMKEKFTNTTNFKVRVCLFYATWCPHCTKYMESGVFNQVANTVKKTSDEIYFHEIDYEENKSLANKYDISGFPTIIAIDANGKLIKSFEGNRNNPRDLEEFAFTSLRSL